MNQSVIINILLKADQTQAGAAAFNNVLKEVVKSAQRAGREIKDALNQAFGATNLKDISAQAKLLQSLANLTNAQAKQEAQQSRLKHAQTVAWGKIELEQVKQLNRERQRAAVAGSPAGVARAAAAASNAEAAALRVLTAEKNRDAAASRAQAAASTAQAAAARAAANAQGAQGAQARAAAAQLRLENLQNRSNQSAGLSSTVFGGNLAANLAAKAISLVTETLKDGISTVFQYSASLEQNKVAFIRLLGSASQANAVLKETQDLTAQTGLRFEAITRRILNTGKSTEETLPLIDSLGKAIVGAGKGQGELERIGLVIEQIISAQRLLGQDANQLKELGFNAYKIVGDEIGRTSAQVRALAQDGKISADVFVNAFEKFIDKKYATAFDDQTKSFTGSLTIIEGKLTQLASRGTDNYFSIISDEAGQAAREIARSNSVILSSLTLVQGYLSTTGRGSIQFGRDFASAIAKIPQLGELVGQQLADILVPVNGKQPGDGILAFLDSLLAKLSAIPVVGNAIGFIGGIVLEIASVFDTLGNDKKFASGLEAAGDAIAEAQKKAEALAKANIENTIQAVDDAIRDLNLRLQFFGDESEVAATKQALLRQNIDITTDAGAQQAIELASQLDVLKANAFAVDNLKNARKGLKEAQFELNDVGNFGQLTQVKLETEEIQKETQFLFAQIQARETLSNLKRGGGLINLQLETEQLQEQVTLTLNQVKARRELHDLQTGGGLTALRVATEKVEAELNATKQLAAVRREYVSVVGGDALRRLQLETGEVQRQTTLYAQIQATRLQLGLPYQTLPTNELQAQGVNIQLQELTTLREELLGGYKDTALEIAAIADENRAFVGAIEILNRQLERFLQLRKALGGPGVFSGPEATAVERARQAANKITQAKFDAAQLKGLQELTKASNGPLVQTFLFYDNGKDVLTAYRGEVRQVISIEQELHNLRQSNQLVGIPDNIATLNIRERRANEVDLIRRGQLANEVVRASENTRQLQVNFREFGQTLDPVLASVRAFVAEIENIPTLKLPVGGLDEFRKNLPFISQLSDVGLDSSVTRRRLREQLYQTILQNSPSVREAILGEAEALRKYNEEVALLDTQNKIIHAKNQELASLKAAQDPDALKTNYEPLLQLPSRPGQSNTTFVRKLVESEIEGLVETIKIGKQQLTTLSRETRSLEEQLKASQERIAVSAETSALRAQVAYQDAYNEIVLADQYAREAQIASQLKLADARTYHADQANAKVLEFLASQRTLTDVISDSKIGVIKTVYDGIDTGLDKITKHLKIAGDLVKELLSGFIKLALNKYFQQFFGLGGGGTGVTGSKPGNGIGNTVIGALTGGFGGGGGFSVGPGGTAVFNPNAAQSGISQSPSANNILTQFLGQSRNPFQIIQSGNVPTPPALPGPGGTVAGNVGPTVTNAGARILSGGSLSLKNLGSSLGPLAPLLGLSLGTSLGGSSRGGTVLGGLGGLALGGTALAFLTPGILTGLLGGTVGASSVAAAGAAGLGGLGVASGLGGAAIGLLTNPFTIAAGVGLLIGAVILGRNAKRRAAEKQSTQIRTDAKSKLNDILAQVKKGQLPTASAMQQANAIRASYLDEVGKIKDKKTRNIGLALVRELDAIIAQIKTEGARQDQARELDKIIVPTFATGGAANFRRYNGLVGDRGLGAGDVIPAFINRDETVINAVQRDRLGGKEAMRRAGVPGYGPVAAPPAYPTPQLATGGNFANGADNGGFGNFMAVIVADEQTADDFVARAKPGIFAKKIVLAKRDDPGFVERLFG